MGWQHTVTGLAHWCINNKEVRRFEEQKDDERLHKEFKGESP